MLVHTIIDGSRVNGPGLRAVVYFQGCLIGCRRCWNELLQPFTGREWTGDEVVSEIAAANRVHSLDGVTFSGGEPMQQALGLAGLVSALRRTFPLLSLGLYSGYTEKELATGNYWTREELSHDDRRAVWQRVAGELDFAVLGRYVSSRPSRLPLRSSANQRLLLLSNRYAECDFRPMEVEVTVDDAGLVEITGFPVHGLPA